MKKVVVLKTIYISGKVVASPGDFLMVQRKGEGFLLANGEIRFFCNDQVYNCLYTKKIVSMHRNGIFRRKSNSEQATLSKKSAKSQQLRRRNTLPNVFRATPLQVPALRVGVSFSEPSYFDSLQSTFEGRKGMSGVRSNSNSGFFSSLEIKNAGSLDWFDDEGIKYSYDEGLVDAQYKRSSEK
jgi:hypothetical protein